MHVLMIPSWYSMPELPYRGIFFAQQAQALQAAGLQVGVVYPEYRSLRSLSPRRLLRSRFQVERYVESGIPTVRLHGWNLGRRFKFGALLWVRQATHLVETYVRQYGVPDLIHAQSVLWAGYTAMRSARVYDRPYVITEHSTAVGRNLVATWQEPYVWAAFSGAQRLFAVSSSLARSMLSYVSEETQIEIVPNMVDTAFFHLPVQPRPVQPFTFLVVGGLVPRKGLQTLLAAFSRHWCGNRDVRLVVAGEGAERTSLESSAHELGVGGQVQFLGALSKERVREAMWQANVLVLPSLYETFGVVLIEAMSTGMPVVATKCGGPEEIVTPGVGWLAEPDDVDSLAGAMTAAYAQYGVLGGAAQSIRDYAIARYDVQKVVSSLVSSYACCINEYSQRVV